MSKSSEVHDFDPVTWKCSRCGSHMTLGSIVCQPHPDYSADPA